MKTGSRPQLSCVLSSKLRAVELNKMIGQEGIGQLDHEAAQFVDGYREQEMQLQMAGYFIFFI